MGRIRTIKPEFFTHEDLSSLPEITHLFAAGLLCYADDEGYFNANEKLLQAAIFPLRESSVSTHCMLTQLSGEIVRERQMSGGELQEKLFPATQNA